MSVQTNLFIDGDECPAIGNARYDVFNPARPAELVGQAASAAIDDVEKAMRAAHQAFKSWSSFSIEERASFLAKIADRLNEDEADVTMRKRLFTQEHGKTLFETNIEVTRLADRFRQVASFADKLRDDPQIKGPQFDTIVTRQSRGVTTLIVPWNWPLAILGSKLPQALLAGNTVVIKLSEQATLAPALTIIRLASLLPKGVVNLITGDGTVIGDTLVGHELVRQVNFTGSIPIGRHVMKTAAQNITPVTLELGGNDAGILLEDAPFGPELFKKLNLSAFLTTGQICMALKRLYVPRRHFADVIDGLGAALAGQVVGDGLKEGVTMGPLNNAKQQQIVKTMTDEADKKGAEVRFYGQIEDEGDFEQGYFLRPSLVVNPEHDLSVVKDEQFGPTLPVIAYDDEEQAIEMANQSDYGLSSSVWSQDPKRAFDVAKKLEAGFTNINGHGPTAMDGLSPFGGVKHSGVGRNFGLEGILQFQETHSISAPGGSLINDE